MSKLSILITALLIIAVLLIGGVVTVLASIPATGLADALAQDAPLDDALPTAVFTADEANRIYEHIVNTSIPQAVLGSAFVLIVTQMIKIVAAHVAWPWLKERRSPEIASFLALLFVAAGVIAEHSGYSGTFDSYAAFLENVGPALLVLLGIVSASSAEFNLLKWLGLLQSRPQMQPDA